MSSATRDQRPANRWVEDLPDFALDFLYDDRDNPSEVTLFPENGSHDLSTNWITVDIDTAIPLHQVR